MKILNPIGSKERFLEMFQGVNKVQLNEVATNILQTGTQLVEKAFEELRNKQANVKQTNTQTVGDDNFVEIITNDNEGNEITFRFKINSTEGDQDDVYNINDVKLVEFKIKSQILNVDMPENMKAVQEFNANHAGEIMDVVSEYANFETDSANINDEVYEEAIKFIDKIPYKKGTETMQTNKAYGDEKPTNPEVRVHATELDKFVSEMQDYVDNVEDIEVDPFALPPEYSAADLPNDDDDGSIGVDPYSQLGVDDESLPNVNPQKAAIITQAYDSLIAAGNPSPTTEQVLAFINQGKSQAPVKKTRTIPRGAEAFYESTDQDKYEDVVFMQGEEADEPLEILRNQGEDAALQYLMQWHDTGNHMGSQELGHGSSDQTYEKDGYIMTWNFLLNYIGLQYDLSAMNEETEKSNYPDQLGKKFKPKNQMPKKKKKPQIVVKLGEQSEIPREYWGNPENEMKEEVELEDDGIKLEPESDAIEQLSQEKEEMGDVLAGGKADDKVTVEFDPEQIAMGIKVEMEHTDNPMIALEIAMDHLTEISDYYTRLDKMEKDAGIGDEEKPEGSDEETTDELLGFKPHNVGDYTDEDFNYAAAERDYEDREDMRQHPEDYEGNEKHPLSDILDNDGTEEDLSKQNTGAKGMNRALDEEDSVEEYQGEIGDRYQDGDGNQLTVRNKVKGGVTLQGQGGEKEIATNDIQFLKKLTENKIGKKEIITEEQVKMARQTLNKRGITEGMTKKEAVQILIKHNIR